MSEASNDLVPPAAQRRTRLTRRLVLVLVVLAFLGVVGALAHDYGYFRAPPPDGGPGVMQATCNSVSNSSGASVQHEASGGTGSNAYFLIVETDPPSPYAGINGSYYVPVSEQWPTINVRVGQVVSIHVINCASSEVHGFQISYYDDKSLIAVQPGQSYNVTFTATEAGTFRVYCGVFCSIHPLMQNGALVVT